MAYRRSIIARAKSFYQQQQQQRFAPSLSHISTRDGEESPAKNIFKNSEIRSRLLMSRALLSRNVSGLALSNFNPAGYGIRFHRNFSEVPSDFEVRYDGGGDLMSEVGDKAVEAAAPVVNEVAVAAADSFAPVAAFQYLIDYVHCCTGLEWWASIAATTLLFRFIQLPLIIHYLKFHAEKLLILDIGRVKKVISKESTVTEIEKETAIMIEEIERFGAYKLTGFLISYVSPWFLFFAIFNMAVKVPSFATGGTLWFMDLTTPDRSICLPILVALTWWIRLELDPINRIKGAEASRKTALKLFAAVAVLGSIAAGFPSAIHCYSITSNLFSIAYGIVMMDPRVPKALGISLRPPPK